MCASGPRSRDLENITPECNPRCLVATLRSRPKFGWIEDAIDSSKSWPMKRVGTLKAASRGFTGDFDSTESRGVILDAIIPAALRACALVEEEFAAVTAQPSP